MVVEATYSVFGGKAEAKFSNDSSDLSWETMYYVCTVLYIQHSYQTLSGRVGEQCNSHMTRTIGGVRSTRSFAFRDDTAQPCATPNARAP